MQTSNVYFSTSPEPEQFLLLQLSPELLDEKLYIKSASSATTVLCTRNATYHLKDVQQSNSLVFIGEAKPNNEMENRLDDGKLVSMDLVVHGEASSWLESIRAKAPKIQIDQVPLYDGESAVHGLARETLFPSIPASEGEILSSLWDGFCVELSGGFVRLEPAYVLRMLHLIVDSLLVAGISLTDIGAKQFLDAVAEDEEDSDVLFFLLRRFSKDQLAYTEESITTVTSERLEHMSLCVTTIVRHVGLCTLILEAQSPLSIDTFLTRWKNSTPMQFRQHCTDVILLSGNYIHPIVTQIQYFAASKLPSDGRARITALLGIRDRWTELELVTFLEDLDGGKKAAQSLIMKHARKVKVGKTVFIERRSR